MSEVAICGARANVMVYDDANRKWVPSGSSPGLSKVQIYQHTVNNTFRVVGRKLQDHEVVINCAILKNLKYNQATQTFHQWRDSRHVYGLNFANKDDSESFANAMLTALDNLNSQGRQSGPIPPPNPPSVPQGGPPGHGHYQQQSQPQPPQQQQQPQPQYQTPQHNGPQFEEHVDLRASRPEHQTHRRYPSGGAPVPYNMPSQQMQQAEPQPQAPPAAPKAPPAPPAAPKAPAAPPAPPAPAAPPAPPAPAAPPAPPAPPTGGPPAAPPPPPAGGAPPPAPPPPPMGGPPSGGGAGGGLAAALAAKANKLKSAEATGGGSSAESSKPPPSSGGDHMSELQKKILARANKAQETEDSSNRNVSPSPAPPQTSSKPWEKSTSNGNKMANGTTGSPKFPRNSRGDSLKRGRNASLTGTENLAAASSGGGTSAGDLENLKQEILTEMRKEMHKIKLEIIEAIRDSAR